MKPKFSYIIWLIVAAGLLIGGWHWSTRTKDSRHLAEIADEIGSIAELRHPYIVPNNAGTRLLVNMDAENGAGAYLFDIASRKMTLLHEDEQRGYDWRQYKMLGWAPGDGYLAYGHQVRQKTNSTDSVPGDLIIAEGTTGKTLATIRVAEDSTNTLSQFAWLSSNSFAFLNGAQDLLVYERKPEGWAKTQSFTNVTGGNLHEARAFDALSSSTVAWWMRGTLWTFDLNAGSTSKLWESTTNSATTNTLVAFWPSRETGKILLVCTNRSLPTGEQQGLYSLDPADKSLVRLFPIRQRISRENPMALINHGKGYEFMSPEASYSTLWFSTNNGTDPTTMFRRAEVRMAVTRGDHIFIAGTLTNEPPGVWDYNVSSGTLECILSGATHGLKNTECVPFEVVSLTNAVGQVFSYHVWKPAHFSPEKKYPLIIGNSPYSWTPFPLAAANMGYWFVTVDRLNWTSPMDDWMEKLLTAFDDIAKNPNIDTNRAMLCVRSEESRGIEPLLERNPALWKGAILLDPITIPDFSSKYVSRIFVTAGEYDPFVLENARAYREKAEKTGIQVDLTVLKGTGHVSYGVAVQQQRVAAMVNFLGEN